VCMVHLIKLIPVVMESEHRNGALPFFIKLYG
jgi:hypothetical protein